MAYSPIILFVLAIITALIVLSLLWYAKWYRMFNGLKHIPGPTPYPIIGNLTQTLAKPSEMFNVLCDWHRQYGHTGKGCFGFEMIILTCDLDLVEFILKSQATRAKGLFYRYFHNWLGQSIFTSKGTEWQERRKLFQPSFNFQMFESFIEVFERNGKILVEKLREEVGNSSFDTKKYVSLYALDAICETIMGTSMNAQNNSNVEYLKAQHEMNRIIFCRVVQPEKHYDLTYQFTDDYKIEQRSVEVMRNFTLSVIKQRREELQANSAHSNSNADEFGRKNRKIFLDILLQATIDGELLTNEAIIEEVNTFMYGGHDTVGACMAFWLYAISTHPKIEARLVAEQREIFGAERNRPITYADIQKMQYLEMTINETLRMYPVAPSLLRAAVEDFTFRDLHVKKGTQIVMLPYYIHHRADLYAEPDKFIPERFHPENIAKRHPFAFLGFSAGPRKCIAQKFALIELKTVLSNLLRQFVICRAMPEHKMKVRAEVLLTSRNGYNIQLKERTW